MNLPKQKFPQLLKYNYSALINLVLGEALYSNLEYLITVYDIIRHIVASIAQHDSQTYIYMYISRSRYVIIISIQYMMAFIVIGDICTHNYKCTYVLHDTRSYQTFYTATSALVYTHMCSYIEIQLHAICECVFIFEILFQILVSVFSMFHV